MNITSLSTHYTNRKRSSKFQRVAYAQRTGRKAIDKGGYEYEVLDLYILGKWYAARLEDLVKAISDRNAVQIEEFLHEWKYYLRAICGLAYRSNYGKGFIIELFDVGLYTTSLISLCQVIEGKE